MEIKIINNNQQKKQDGNITELKEQVQRKNPDLDQNVEEETIGDGSEQRIVKVGKVTVGDTSNMEKDNAGDTSNMEKDNAALFEEGPFDDLCSGPPGVVSGEASARLRGNS
ncbi:hypothetical protein SUGI_0581280 [Cryptomeria japonica]|nr:hypothetical protein SUGI_0581280 [Cryptomeria japonica]